MLTKIMAYITFITTLLILSAYGRNIMKDKTMSNQESQESSELESVYEPLARHNIKRLLAEAILRPRPLPKLRFKNSALGSGALRSGAKLTVSNIQEQMHVDKGNNLGADALFAVGLPKLVASLPKLARKGGAKEEQTPGGKGTTINGQLTGEPFPFLAPRVKPTWLMGTSDLKAETCQVELFNQTVTSKGCRPLVLESRLCTGRCNSFFVPSSNADFQSCASCFPATFSVKTVILDCPERKRGYKIKQMHVIKSCKCQSMMSCSP